jgi:Flp pilus assembly protein TadD
MRTNEAAALLEKSLSTKPDARVAIRSSQVAKMSGDLRKASAILANWIAKHPNDYDIQRDHAGLVMESGDLVGARKEYEALLKQRPEDPIILNNIGVLLEKDDPKRALSLVSLAVKIAPRSAEFADTLGWMKYQRRDLQGALPQLQRAHDMAVNNAPISYHLALVLDATGRRAEAKTLLQTTLAKNPKFEGAADAKQLLARW